MRFTNIFSNFYCWFVSKAVTRLLDYFYTDFPPVVRIETTNACNAECIMCPRTKMTRKIGVMEQALYEKIIDECAANNVSCIHLHNFGEPLLDKRFPERVAYAKRKKIRRVKFFTNGALLTQEQIMKLLEAQPDEIKISIDAATKNTFEKIRQGLNYNEVCENINRFLSLRRKMRKHLPKIELIYVEMKENEAEKEDFIRHWKNKVDRIYFDKEHNWAVNDSVQKKPEIFKACLRVWSTLTILWHGQVALCCLDYDGEKILGDLNHSTIREIWQNEAYRRVRNIHRTRYFKQLPICYNCSKSRLI